MKSLSSNASAPWIAFHACHSNPFLFSSTAKNAPRHSAGSTYDWNFKTIAQSNLADCNLALPMACTIHAHGRAEINAWASLIGDEDYWNWYNFYNVMKTIETFTPPRLTPVSTVPADLSIPHIQLCNQLRFNGNWTKSCLAAGIESQQDSHGGENWAAFISTSAINPHGLIPAPPRIIWDTSSSEIKAKSVVWQVDTTDSEHTITVNKEDILSGGVVGSPHILLLSGVAKAVAAPALADDPVDGRLRGGRLGRPVGC
ncbi:uncharacterized protein ARMOST_07644 [Armillaria ostoyae]|uniref:Glucose-methanol-choline oxidoreductase N-terminal domain-containing protein n=1 Tax=Armillaria ostoyae TaxID=47428 RepID=A0A284R6D2_ARMOS|nr:uncharacterized protein ARMOST_07644 [Armillaria ostoyae]